MILSGEEQVPVLRSRLISDPETAWQYSQSLQTAHTRAFHIHHRTFAGIAQNVKTGTVFFVLPVVSSVWTAQTSNFSPHLHQAHSLLHTRESPVGPDYFPCNKLITAESRCCSSGQTISAKRLHFLRTSPRSYVKMQWCGDITTEIRSETFLRALPGIKLVCRDEEIKFKYMRSVSVRHVSSNLLASRSTIEQRAFPCVCQIERISHLNLVVDARCPL